jgi:hypothetical protein
LTGLIMTLPEIMRQALWKQHRDSSLRLVYPVGEWTVEESECPGALILTLRTPDGFQMSFAVSHDDLRDMAKVGVEPAGRPLRH